MLPTALQRNDATEDPADGPTSPTQATDNAGQPCGERHFALIQQDAFAAVAGPRMLNIEPAARRYSFQR
jgi:hypothetical protein